MVPVSGTLTHTVPQEVNKLGPHHVNLTQPDVMVFVVLLRTACGISIVDGPTYRCLQEFRFVVQVCCSCLLSLAHNADCLCLNPLSPTHLSLVPYILSCSLCLAHCWLAGGGQSWSDSTNMSSTWRSGTSATASAMSCNNTRSIRRRPQSEKGPEK